MKIQYRTVFISDIHLGTKISQAEKVLNFLKSIKIKKLYLVGDIIDISQFKRRFYWPSNHTAVIRRILKLSKNKVKVVYIPGNHDRELRGFTDMHSVLKMQDIHKTKDGKRFLVVHGDEFDGVLREKWMFLYAIGDWSYDFAIFISRIINNFTGVFGVNWSLSKYLKNKVKNVIKFLNNFEKLIVHEARKNGVDGVICGHIHTPELKNIQGMIYANCGCWTENCSVLVEHLNGELELLKMDEMKVKKKKQSEKVNNKIPKKLAIKAHDKFFRSIHKNNLIYNACWEDPRLDREIMNLDEKSKVVMVSSAGCNALDYLLDSPERIFSVDLNPRQNALVELKKAVIKKGSYEDLFAMFGKGIHPDIECFYKELCPGLPKYVRDFWDKKIYYFSKPRIRSSFYYHGTAGKAAWIFKSIFKSNKKLREQIYLIFEAKSIEEQQDIFAKIEDELWNAFSSNLVKNPLIMVMLGVPRPQIKLINKQYPGGLEGFVKDKLKHVFTTVPIRDNYFWRVYFTGEYTPECCPNYLKKENFEFLRENVDRIKCFSMSFTDFLKKNPGEYSHFVLLDHQDWLAWNDPQALEEEWNQIFRNSYPGSKILLRSAGFDVDFLNDIDQSKIKFRNELTMPLHRLDRVGTYGSFHMAEVV